MSFHVKDNFLPGAPISQVPASWFNKVGSFLNNLIGANGVKVTKNDQGASTIELDADSTPDAPSETFVDVGGFPDDVSQEAAMLWERGSGKGCKLLVLYKSDDGTGGAYEVCAAQLTYSKDGRLAKVEALADKGIYVPAN